MKKLNIWASLILAITGMFFNSAIAEEQEFEPYTHEQVMIKLVEPATREQNGVIQIIPSRDTPVSCRRCNEKLKISSNTKTVLRLPQLEGSAVELDEHLGKIAEVYVTKPGYASRISFEQ
jgi:hypothetical protein